MFFLLSKLLFFLLTPIIWLWALLIRVLIKFRKTPVKKSIIFIITLLYVCTNSWFVQELVRPYELQTMHLDSLAEYDIGIVLGGFNTYDATFDRINFNASSDRLLQAILLYKQGKIKKILLSGGEGRILKEGYSEAEITQRYLLQIGIPPHDILIENRSRNTFENAKHTAELLGTYPQKLLLITSAIHMRRAIATFEKQALHCDYFTTDRRSGKRKFVFDHCFVPNIGAMQLLGALIKETVGYCVYWLRGYI